MHVAGKQRIYIEFVILRTQFYLNFSILHNHDDCDGVNRIVSFGFRLSSMPVSAGIIIEDEPSKSVLLRMIRFFIAATIN